MSDKKFFPVPFQSWSNIFFQDADSPVPNGSVGGKSHPRKSPVGDEDESSDIEETGRSDDAESDVDISDDNRKKITTTSRRRGEEEDDDDDDDDADVSEDEDDWEQFQQESQKVSPFV